MKYVPTISERHPFFTQFNKKKMNSYWYDHFTGNQIEALYYASLEHVAVDCGKNMSIFYARLAIYHLVVIRGPNWATVTKQGRKLMKKLRQDGVVPKA
jgi:hypothetical protein